MRNKSTVEKTASDYERYEKNRRRRLLKEESRRNPPSTTPESRATATAVDKVLKCKECLQDIFPPYHVYVCQDNRLHHERVGGQQPHVKVNFTISFISHGKCRQCRAHAWCGGGYAKTICDRNGLLVLVAF